LARADANGKDIRDFSGGVVKVRSVRIRVTVRADSQRVSGRRTASSYTRSITGRLGHIQPVAEGRDLDACLQLTTLGEPGGKVGTEPTGVPEQRHASAVQLGSRSANASLWRERSSQRRSPGCWLTSVDNAADRRLQGAGISEGPVRALSSEGWVLTREGHKIGTQISDALDESRTPE
jgi:hypothetical protein